MYYSLSFKIFYNLILNLWQKYPMWKRQRSQKQNMDIKIVQIFTKMYGVVCEAIFSYFEDSIKGKRNGNIL